MDGVTCCELTTYDEKTLLVQLSIDISYSAYKGAASLQTCDFIYWCEMQFVRILNAKMKIRK